MMSKAAMASHGVMISRVFRPWSEMYIRDEREAKLADRDEGQNKERKKGREKKRKGKT